MKLLLIVFTTFFAPTKACSFSSKKIVEEQYVLNLIAESDDSFLQILSKKNKPIFFTKLDTLPYYSEGFTILNSPDSLRLKTVVVSDEYDIKLFTYEFMPSDYDDFHNEYIQVQNIKISIDSLLNAKHNEVMEEDPYIYWQNVSYFSYNKHNYVLVYGGSRNFYMNGTICSHLLFDFTNNRFNNAWIFYNGYCSNSVFNDFDGDGILDYVKWGQNSSEINLFHFTNNTLIKDSIYYVTVHPSKDEIKDLERGMFNSYTDIDKKRSKWFYPLK